MKQMDLSFGGPSCSPLPKQHVAEENHLERSRVAQHAYNDDYHIVRNEVKILETETRGYIENIRKRHARHFDNVPSVSLEISPIFSPLICK
jgi:hypothetical protein